MHMHAYSSSPEITAPARLRKMSLQPCLKVLHRPRGLHPRSVEWHQHLLRTTRRYAQKENKQVYSLEQLYLKLGVQVPALFKYGSLKHNKLIEIHIQVFGESTLLYKIDYFGFGHANLFSWSSGSSMYTQNQFLWSTGYGCRPNSCKEQTRPP